MNLVWTRVIERFPWQLISLIFKDLIGDSQ